MKVHFINNAGFYKVIIICSLKCLINEFVFGQLFVPEVVFGATPSSLYGFVHEWEFGSEVRCIINVTTIWSH